MSLLPKILLAQSAGNQSVLLRDVTGNYNVNDNTGGYGSPNTAINDVSSAIVQIKFPQYENPYSYDFTVVSGAITDAVRTDPMGNSVNIFSALPNTLFPLDMVLSSAIIFGNSTDKFSDAKIQTTYLVTDGSTSIQYNTDQVFWFYLDKLLCLNEMNELYLDGKITAEKNAEYNNLFQGFLLSIQLYQVDNADEYFANLTNYCKKCH